MAIYKGNNGFSHVRSLKNHLLTLKGEEKTIVTTNGCFDIIHGGHIQYLIDASSFGDFLIVGVNCDEVVRKLKGKKRPVQNERDRLAIISSLRMVDFGFIFYEDDPRAFLKILQPDIHIKGGDYTEDIIEKPVVEAYGGTIKIVSFKPGCSTTNIIGKINSLA